MQALAHSDARMPTACLVMRSVLSRYPSSAFQAALLAENGFRVVVCDIDDGGYDTMLLPPGVERHIVEHTTDLISGKHASRVTKLFRRRAFQIRLHTLLRGLNPDLVISYDPPAFAAMARISRNQKPPKYLHVWHCHEAAILSPDMGWGTRRDINLTRQEAQLADIVIVPDRHRIKSYFGGFPFKTPPVVVMNCPRRIIKRPRPNMSELLPCQAGQADLKTVLYLGSVGEGHGLETAIIGMRFWPKNSRFLLVGPMRDSYRCRLLSLAKSCGEDGRVFLTGPIAANRAWGVRAAASIALTVMDVSHPIYRYCAGASNKRFEAMAAGLAQVTNNGPGIKELFTAPGVALAVNHDDAKAMGNAVGTLLSNSKRRDEMARRARSLHLQKYNYEEEFMPVLCRIMEALEHRAI